MKKWIGVFSAIILLVSLAQSSTPESKNQKNFEMMKSLEGTWEGDGPDGKPAKISYKVVSAGSAVMETIDHGDMPGMMVTMYHLDGNKLMMTHYCATGNQPRMRLVSSTPTELTFEMFDATNLASAKDTHMRKLVIRWTDKNHITADWTMSKDGKDENHGVFKLERKA
jgi:hypothetical protein